MQFSTRSLLIGFAFMAIGCGGIIYANQVNAYLFVTATLVIIFAAIVQAIIRRGRAQAFWIGFSVFAAGYFWTAMSVEGLPVLTGSAATEGLWQEPKLATSAALLAIDDFLLNAGLGPRLTQVRGAYSPDSTSRVSYGFGSSLYTLEVGHSIFAILVGILGGWWGLWVAALAQRDRARENA